MMRIGPVLAIVSILAASAHAAPGAEPWCGFQAGVQLGHTSLSIDRLKVNAVDPDYRVRRDVAASGVDYGLFAGYVLPLGPLRLGIEADLSSNRSEENNEDDLIDNTRFQFKETHGIGVRIGYPLAAGALLYVRVGWEAARTEFHQVDPIDPPSRAHATRTLNGTRVGLGVELALTPQWHLRADYGWTRFGRLEATETFEQDGQEQVWAQWSMKPTSYRFRLAIAYRF